MFRQIVIIEKSKIIREGIISLLSAHKISRSVVSMESLDEWLQTIGETKPEVVIVGYDLVREGVEKIRAKHHLERTTAFVGIIYGYYLLKDVTDIFDEVVYITEDETVIVNKLHHLHKNMHAREVQEEGHRLTDREKNVLHLLVQGFANKEVADKLAISTHTVISHRKNIIEKTGIRSLAGLAVYAILNNIAEIDDLKN